ncbi:response regulator transcription factor [Aeromicrobium sp. CTD01-1L150]|uniref:response regulator transcription factor n=1 Tax=Aeromicrobium sp. CTD01-1L150 TaxID=3341830 RepID=UPI0035BFF148
MAGSVIDVLRGQVLDDGGDALAITSVLTPREQEVLRLVAHGLSNHDIMERFVLSEATVKTHVWPGS